MTTDESVRQLRMQLLSYAVREHRRYHYRTDFESCVHPFCDGARKTIGLSFKAGPSMSPRESLQIALENFLGRV